MALVAVLSGSGKPRGLSMGTDLEQDPDRDLGQAVKEYQESGMDQRQEPVEEMVVPWAEEEVTQDWEELTAFHQAWFRALDKAAARGQNR